jgi:dihydrofolate reductase
MKTQFYTASTIDGFIATEDDSLDWLFALGSPTESTYNAFIADVGALAMGSVTYEWILSHSKEVIAETGSAWPYNQPTWIFTRRKLPSVPGADIRFTSGDVRAAHAEMRAAAGGKNIWVVGGGELVGQFFDTGLLDEIIMQIGSAALGRGKPLFPRRAVPPALNLTSVQRIGAEFVELRYAIARPNQP